MLSPWRCQNPHPTLPQQQGSPKEKPVPQRPLAQEPKIVPKAPRELRDGEVRPWVGRVAGGSSRTVSSGLPPTTHVSSQQPLGQAQGLPWDKVKR